MSTCWVVECSWHSVVAASCDLGCALWVEVGREVVAVRCSSCECVVRLLVARWVRVVAVLV
eukprot:509457-Amphidinium_carterae.1